MGGQLMKYHDDYSIDRKLLKYWLKHADAKVLRKLKNLDEVFFTQLCKRIKVKCDYDYYRRDTFSVIKKMTIPPDLIYGYLKEDNEDLTPLLRFNVYPELDGTLSNLLKDKRRIIGTSKFY